jgi:hypothetical protein
VESTRIVGEVDPVPLLVAVDGLAAEAGGASMLTTRAKRAAQSHMSRFAATTPPEDCLQRVVTSRVFRGL